MMGGGEGVGSLGNMAEALYVEFVNTGVDAEIVVVCGRNERLKKELEGRDWKKLLNDSCPDMAHSRKAKKVKSLVNHLHKISKPFTKDEAEIELFISDDHDNNNGVENIDDDDNSFQEIITGKVTVTPLGFINNMAEYMVAADVLVSKAGPGTIAEAAALSLPVLLTSFLPGQEEGNVDYVVEGEFGAFCSDSDPIGISEEVCMWLTDEVRLKELSDAAKATGT